MAHVANNTPTVAPSGPLMDRLTHAVIKETSKTLRYYIDVKHRENAFIVNPNSSVANATPLRARFLYGTAKGSSSFYSTAYKNNNFQQILPNYQQKRSQPTLISPEKQMCREELNFHMRSYQFYSRDASKSPDPRLRAIYRSNSASTVMREGRTRSAVKLTRHAKDQLIDDAANLLANMVKTRQTVQDLPPSIRQSPLMYISRSLDPSPRPFHVDHPTRIRSVHTSLSNPTTESRTFTMSQLSNDSRPSKQDPSCSTTSKMSTAKPIKKGFLCQYKISITTGNCNGASTDAPIRIKFYGSNGCTDFYALEESETHRVPFVKGQTDLFTVQTYHVGQLFGITIGHERQDMRSSWYLTKVMIDDSVTDTTYEVACNSWLSIKSMDQKTMRDFPVTSMISRKEKNDVDDHPEDNRSQSDYSTTITEATAILNKSNDDDDENDSMPDLPTKKIHRKQHHVSIGPTYIAKKPTLITADANDLSHASPHATITFEQRLTRNDCTPVTIPVRRFNSPALSTTSSDTELRGTMANGTGSTTTPTPTLNPTGLQSILEHGKVRRTARSASSKRMNLDFERPPARLDQRSSSVSVSSERAVKQKHKTQH